MLLHCPTAVFWDYENVRLKRSNWQEFLNALRNMYSKFPVEFIKIYVRKSSLNSEDREILGEWGYRKTNFKLVKENGKNSVDYILMQSCVDVLRTRPQIKQIVLITGDGDFKALVKQLKNYRVIVICQKGSYNKSLAQLVDQAYSVNLLASDPEDWFRYR